MTENTQPQIGPQSCITLHFAIRLENGDQVDSTFEGAPATFCYGDGNLLPGFEAALQGLSVGDRQTLRILPEQGFGMHNPSNIQILPRKQFSDITLEPGLVLSFAASEGELPGVVSELMDDEVAIDFNHPLAGHTLYFEVQILDVQIQEGQSFDEQSLDGQSLDSQGT